jgi:hypothetical protein
VRSSARFRDLAFGTARACAEAIELEIDVMRTPGKAIAGDVAAGNPIQQGPNWLWRTAFQGSRERWHFSNVDVAMNQQESIMQRRLQLSALIAMSLIGATASALAQNAGAAAGAQIGNAPGVGTNPPVGAPQKPASAGISQAPAGSSTTTTGTGGGPRTSTPTNGPHTFAPNTGPAATTNGMR